MFESPRGVGNRDSDSNSTPELPSYGNQSIDLHSKSVDWFLYGTKFGYIITTKQEQNEVRCLFP